MVFHLHLFDVIHLIYFLFIYTNEKSGLNEMNESRVSFFV